MLTALRLILSLTGRRAGLFGAHAQARATHVALLAVFGAAAAVFLLTLVTVALAKWLGAIAALAIMAGVFAVACAGVVIAMQAERRAHRDRMLRQGMDDRRIMQAALLTALPAVRKGGMLAVGAAALALLLLNGRRRDPDDDD